MKCIQYWPENGETQQFTTVEVTHQETLEFEDHIERTFWMKQRKVSMPLQKVKCHLKVPNSLSAQYLSVLNIMVMLGTCTSKQERGHLQL